MKKINLFLMITLIGGLVFGFSACDDKETAKYDATISVEPTSISDFSAAGGSQTFTVTVEPSATWTAVPAESWADVSTSGGTFTITVGLNPNNTDRTNTVTVSAEGAKPLVMSFKQLANNESVTPTLSIENEPTESAEAESGTVTFDIVSNTSWTITKTAAWITTINPDQGTGNKTITVTLAANEGEARSTDLTVATTVATETLSETVTISQAASGPATSVIIDQLVGTYTVAEGFYYGTGEAWVTSDQLVITKTGPSTISVSQIWKTYFQDYSGLTFNDIVVDDASSKILIPAQKVEESLMNSQYDTWLTATTTAEDPNYKTGTIEGTISTTSGVTIKIKAFPNIPDTEDNTSLIIGAVRKSDDIYMGFAYLAYATTWTKTEPSPGAPAAMAPEAMTFKRAFDFDPMDASRYLIKK